jgi:hypothetical protein
MLTCIRLSRADGGSVQAQWLIGWWRGYCESTKVMSRRTACSETSISNSAADEAPALRAPATRGARIHPLAEGPNPMRAAEIVFPCLGLLMSLLGWPLAVRRVAPNRWYGLRVPATFADTRVWYDANALAGRDMVTFGAVVAVVTLVLRHATNLDDKAYAGTCAAIIGIGSLLLAARGWRAANRLLHERRQADRS